MEEGKRLPEIGAEVMDSQEVKLRKSLLIFASAFMTFAVMLWLAIYWMMGLNFSSNVPLGYQAISVGSLIYYMRTRNFEVFRFIQLTLFLFAPFIMQWSIGSSITSSGVALWALLAPIGALVVSSWKESIPWFFAYIVLTAVSGFFDYYLGAGTATGIPMNTIGLFFALNFAAMSSILYFLVRYFVIETEKIKTLLDRKVAGWEHAGQLAVINRNLKFTPWAMTFADAQFLQSRAFQIEEVARWFGIPPFALMQTEKQTSWGTGIESQQRGLARTVLAPWTTRIEQALSPLLPVEWFLRFDFTGLERATPAEEADLVISKYDAGLMTRNEARQKLGLPRVEGGDDFKTGGPLAAFGVDGE